MPIPLQEEIRLLSMVDILAPLSDEQMEDLAKRAPDTFLDQDDILYTPKEGTERLFILKQGRVQLYEVSAEGEEITLSVIEDGNIFGEMVLTGQSLKGLHVRALTPSTVVSLRRQDVEDLIRDTPEVGLRLVRDLAQRLQDSERRHYTHEQLASIIGCKRVAVTRAFRKLEGGGAVELKERRIVVKDIDALKDMAEAS